ncbi:MAG TPA: ABC transporter permease, partial [Chloroflexota bacterium]|nr:ABC transporter permease [Chloroflexota bacterium]
LAQTILSLFGMSLLIFLLVRASGDPTDLMRNSAMTEQDMQNVRISLGLDKPMPEQYLIYMNGLIHGDLGRSLVQRRTVSSMIGAALPNSLKLAGPSFVIGIGAALVLGVLGATRRDTWLDGGVKLLAVLGQALPTFWVGLVAIFLFAVHWHLLPTSGLGGPDHFVMPVLVLAFFLMPGMMRLVRSSMLDVLDSEYVKLARIKGVPERVVIWKHALRNALVAPLTAAGAIFAGLFAGTVFIETVFAWPGLGYLTVSALSGRDFPVVQDIVLLIAAVTLIINLLVDITYAYIDPRIRY